MAIVRPVGRRRARPASRSRSNPLPSGAGCSPCPLRSRQSAANPESASLAAKPNICSLQPPYPCASTAPALALGGARRYAGTRCPSSDTRSSSLMNSVGIWPPPATGRTIVVSSPNPVIDSLLGLCAILTEGKLARGKTAFRISDGGSTSQQSRWRIGGRSGIPFLLALWQADRQE